MFMWLMWKSHALGVTCVATALNTLEDYVYLSFGCRSTSNLLQIHSLSARNYGRCEYMDVNNRRHNSAVMRP